MAPKQTLESWVDDRLATLTPSHSPDIRRARARLAAQRNSGTPHGRRYRFAALATGCAAIALVAALPVTRVTAQQIFNRLFLPTVTVVRVDPDRLPWALHIDIGQNSPVAASTREEAASSAGFTPALPTYYVRPPELSVLGPIHATVDLQTKELRQALQSAGASEVEVPETWNGTRLGIQVSPVIIAKWEDDTSLLQLRPIALNTPAGFPLQDFVKVAFRILGLDAGAADRMASQFAAQPTWFLGIPQDEPAQMREVALHSGPGMLIEDFKEDDGSPERTALIWSTADRTFLLSGDLSPDRAVAIANSVR